jgi:hypothetical protein
VATPAAGVLRTSEAQSEGLVAGIPHQEEGDLPNEGENTEDMAFVPLSGSAPAVASSSRPGSGAGMPDELRGALVPVSGGGAVRHKLQVATRDDPGRVLLVIDGEEEHASPKQLRRAIRRQAASAEEVATAAMLCVLPHAFLSA